MLVVWFENPVWRERGPQPCPLTRKIILLIDSSHEYVGCDVQTTVRRVLQSTNRPKVHVVVSYLCHECLHSQTTHGWNSLRHLFTPSSQRASWRLLLAVSCWLLAVALRAQHPG